MGEQVRLCEPDMRLREGKGKRVFDGVSSASLLDSIAERGVSKEPFQELYWEIWCRWRKGTTDKAGSDGIEACCFDK